MSEFVTNMFQYNVTVGITRSEVIFCVRLFCFDASKHHSASLTFWLLLKSCHCFFCDLFLFFLGFAFFKFHIFPVRTASQLDAARYCQRGGQDHVAAFSMSAVQQDQAPSTGATEKRNPMLRIRGRTIPGVGSTNRVLSKSVSGLWEFLNGLRNSSFWEMPCRCPACLWTLCYAGWRWPSHTMSSWSASCRVRWSDLGTWWCFRSGLSQTVISVAVPFTSLTILLKRFEKYVDPRHYLATTNHS